MTSRVACSALHIRYQLPCTTGNSLRILKRWVQVAAEESGPGPSEDREYSILMGDTDKNAGVACFAHAPASISQRRTSS